MAQETAAMDSAALLAFMDEPTETETPTAPAPELDAVPQPAREALALSGWVDPTVLYPDGDTSLESALERSALVRSCQVEKQETGMGWRMQSSPRLETLTALVKTGRLSDALAGPLPTTDHPGEWLRRALQEGPNLALDTLTSEELSYLAAALELLAGLDAPLPDIAEVRQRLGRATAFDEYSMLLKNGFIGRKAEYAHLQEFLHRVAEPGLTWTGLLLCGAGGSGKSTLLAEFLSTAAAEESTALVVFDFDRPGMSPGDTFWLEAEASRQIAYQRPEHTEMLGEARHNARKLAEGAYARQAREASSIMFHAIRVALSDGAGMLLVFDTFEEVVQLEQVPTLLEWVTSLADALWPVPLRVIFSGRIYHDNEENDGEDPLSTRKEIAQEDRLPLGEFTPEEALEFLLAYRVPADTARRIAESDWVPRRPLELKLLAELIQSTPTSLQELEKELQDGGEAAKSLFVGMVYRRVLRRLERGDALVQQLAYPGLVLRYVTRELIQEVLCPVLGIAPMSDEEADRALNRLARYRWLAYRKGDQVWHRKDLRRSTLKAMIAQEPEQARAISQRAITYFESLGTSEARLEASYHRLLLGEPPENLNELAGLSRQLQGDLADFPRTSRALLDYAQRGDTLSMEQVALLPDQYRDSAYQQLGERFVRDGEYSAAARLHRQSGSGTEGSLQPWEIEALFQTALWGTIPPPPAEREIDSLVDLAAQLHPWALMDQLGVTKKAARDFLRYYRNSVPTGNGPSIADAELCQIANGLLVLFQSSGGENSSERAILDFLGRLEKDGYPPLTCSTMLRLLMLCILVEDRDFREVRSALSETPFLKPFIKIDRNWIAQHTFKGLDNHLGGTRLPTVRALLRAVDDIPEAEILNVGRERQGDRIRRLFQESAARDLRGPDQEWRNPCRCALLDAFPTPADWEELGKLLLPLLPEAYLRIPTPAEFVQELESDANLDLKNYMELIDRCWALPRLMEQAHAARPDAVRLARVYEAYQKWDELIYGVLRSRGRQTTRNGDSD